MFLRLFALFVTIPLIELYLLLQVGRLMGLVPTLALVISTGFLGAWLAQSQGASTFARIRDELNAGRMPTESLAHALLILVAGAVLLTPGLLTDCAGFFLLIPQGRRLVAGSLRKRFEKHLRARATATSQARSAGGPMGAGPMGGGPMGGGFRIDFGGRPAGGQSGHQSAPRGGPRPGPKQVLVVEDYRVDEAPSEEDRSAERAITEGSAESSDRSEP